MLTGRRFPQTGNQFIRCHVLEYRINDFEIDTLVAQGKFQMAYDGVFKSHTSWKQNTRVTIDAPVD